MAWHYHNFSGCRIIFVRIGIAKNIAVVLSRTPLNVVEAYSRSNPFRFVQKPVAGISSVVFAPDFVAVNIFERRGDQRIRLKSISLLLQILLNRGVNWRIILLL
jgi:hypothetical protein